jgi:hypothetical protein
VELFDNIKTAPYSVSTTQQPLTLELIMITILALVIRVLMALVTPTHVDVVVIPPMPQYSADELFEECLCDECCYEEAVKAYADEFTALFNSYTYKLSKNGRSMINGKFVAMGAK